MKKILMGLVAVSTLSFAAQPNLNNPQDNTTVFNTNQTGLINVKGTITSDVPVVKYVVYASADGRWATAENELVLADFLMSTSSSSGFQAVNPKIWVRKANGTNDGVLPLLNEKVEFRIDIPSYTAYNPILEFGKVSKMKLFPTAIFPKAVLQQKLTSAGLSGKYAVKEDWGSIVLASNVRKAYRGYYEMSLEVIENGVLEIKNEDASSLLVSDSMLGEADYAVIANIFAGGLEQNVPVIVKIK